MIGFFWREDDRLNIQIPVLFKSKPNIRLHTFFDT